MVILLCYQYFIKEKNYTIREIRYVVHNFPTSNCLIWTISFCSGELNHGISVVITSLLSFYFLFFSSIFNLHSIHCCHRVPGGVEIKEESITHSRGLVQSRNIFKKNTMKSRNVWSFCFVLFSEPHITGFTLHFGIIPGRLRSSSDWTQSGYVQDCYVTLVPNSRQI